MALDPATLDDEQAQRVLLELFELLPAAGKPAFDELDSLLGDLREAAPAEVAQPLGRLGDNAELRGALARQSLAALAAEPSLAPLLDQAAERAARPHMAGVPELIAGVVVILALLPTHIEKDANGSFSIQWHQLQNLAAVLKPVSNIVKALPKSLLDRLG